MTLTTKAVGWLDGNRYRSYPFDQDEWRAKVPADSGLDCVVVDALVVDVGHDAGASRLVVKKIEVGDDDTVVTVGYGSQSCDIAISGGEESGPESFEAVVGRFYLGGGMYASVTVHMSSHAYILSRVGAGTWDFGDGVRVMPARHVCITDGCGLMGVRTNGSANVQGGGVATGDVLLEDGYRTSPVVEDGHVLVRVGRKYGIDPCHYPVNTQSEDCSRLLFFFCGQNAVNSGNVNIEGGRGISVEQGGKYGGIPCIEIKADKELLELYSPEHQD